MRVPAVGFPIALSLSKGALRLGDDLRSGASAIKYAVPGTTGTTSIRLLARQVLLMASLRAPEIALSRRRVTLKKRTSILSDGGKSTCVGLRHPAHPAISSRMAENSNTSDLPTVIADAVSGVPKALIPSSIKALDRLIGAATDIPTAWLAQKKARIDAQTQAFVLVEKAIAETAATGAAADRPTVERAMSVLVRKEYRKQMNREAIASAMLEDLRLPDPDGESTGGGASKPVVDVDEDWLNVFERYAEDASTERMQRLWGRVLAGEVRKPGRFSLRTLRFLSEFSQADALLFADFCNSTFVNFAPSTLVKADGPSSDISSLISLEASGLIQGASGSGLSKPLTFNDAGHVFLKEDRIVLHLEGKPSDVVAVEVCVLTTLGQELSFLLPDRDPKSAARSVANAIKVPGIKAAYLLETIGDGSQAKRLEILWEQPAPTIENVEDPSVA